MSDAAPAIRPKSLRVRLTPAGRGLGVFVGASLLLSWGAGGLLAVYAAAGIALFAAIPLLAFLHAQGLRVHATEPVTAFAGEPFPIDLELENTAHVLAVRDLVVLYPSERTGSERPAGFAATVRPSSRVTVQTTHRLLRRGRHERIALIAETAFPLGLVSVRLAFVLPSDVLVLPRLGMLRNLGALTARRHGMLYQGASDRGDEQEFHGLREWREGESQRRVHWKLSARRGRLLVREFRGEDIPPIHVVLDLRVPARKRTSASSRRRGSFEAAVSLAATLVEHHLRRRHLVRFTAKGGDAGFTTERSRGRAALFPVLAALAEVDAQPLDGVRSLDADVRSGEMTFVVCAGASRDAEGVPRDAVLLDVERRETADVFVRARPGAATALFGRTSGFGGV